MDLYTRDKEKIIYILMAYALNAILIVDLVYGICGLLGVTTMISAYVHYIGYALILGYSIYITLFRPRLLYFAAWLLTIIFILISEIRISTFFQGDTSALFGVYSITLLRFVPVFILSGESKNYEQFVQYFKPYVYIAILYGFFNIMVLDTLSSDYMTFSYNLLLPSLFAYHYYIVKKRNAFLLISIILFSFMLFFGARGPIVCFISGIILIEFVVIRKNTLKKIVLVTLLIAITIVIALNYNSILLFFHAAFPNSRTINMLISTKTLDYFLSGRSEVFSKCMLLKNKYPLLGLGVFSSNYYLSLELGYSEYVQGVYPHNLFLDILLQFGIIIGSILMIFLIIVVLKSIKKIVSFPIELQVIYCIFFSRSVISLLVSGTYITEITFAFLLGMCVNFNYGIISNGLVQIKSKR